MKSVDSQSATPERNVECTVELSSGASNLKLQYRRDLDGLRGLAVIAVVLLHAGFEPVPGLFVGLELFFVVSGFLITSLLLRRIEADAFSFPGFYLNRIRRLIPAASVVTILTLIAGYFILLPSDYEHLAISGLWSMLSASNFFFFLDSVDYFRADAQDLPLLHMWSLSLEEQFYLLWPCVLYLGMRFLKLKWLTLVTVVLGACSFLIAQLLLLKHPQATYFLLPSRAGEFLVGCVLGQVMTFFRHGGWASW